MPRADLREEATAANARDVIKLMECSMQHFFRDSIPDRGLCVWVSCFCVGCCVGKRSVKFCLVSSRTCTYLQARQLDSLVRLTVARARADLREEATAGDARDVMELVKYSMRDFFRDSIPFLRVGGSGKCRSGAKADGRRLMQALQSMKRTQGKDRVSMGEIAAIADELGLHSVPLQELIEGLNEAGELLKKGGQTYAF